MMSGYLVSKLGHVVLQAALVVGLLTHLDQDVEVTVLLSQRRHPLVLTQFHWTTEHRRPETLSLEAARRISPQTDTFDALNELVGASTCFCSVLDQERFRRGFVTSPRF